MVFRGAESFDFDGCGAGSEVSLDAFRPGLDLLSGGGDMGGLGVLGCVRGVAGLQPQRF